MATEQERADLVHITTVPASLDFVSGQIGYMQARGFAIRAISSPGARLQAIGEREGIPVYGVEMPRCITPLRDLAAVARIWRCIRAIRPLIVHSHTPKGGLLGMTAAWLARVPVRIYHIHGLPLMTATGTRRLLLRCSEKVSCILAHQVLCVSNSIRRTAIEERLCPASKIKVLHHGSINGVDAEIRHNPARLGPTVRAQTRGKYRIPPEALVVGFIGRIVRDKGMAELAEAWGRIRDEFPNLYLLVVGPFEPQDPLPPEAERVLRNDPRIVLTGVQYDTPLLFSAMDVVLLPTYREGLPVVPLEAAAMSLPVVATNVPGCVDAVVNGVTGTLVPPRDATALADAIRTYLLDPELRLRHGQAGRERVLRDFRPEDIWEAVYQEYVSLLRQKGIPVPRPDAVAGTPAEV